MVNCELSGVLARMNRRTTWISLSKVVQYSPSDGTLHRIHNSQLTFQRLLLSRCIPMLKSSEWPDPFTSRRIHNSQFTIHNSLARSPLLIRNIPVLHAQANPRYSGQPFLERLRDRDGAVTAAGAADPDGQIGLSL